MNKARGRPMTHAGKRRLLQYAKENQEKATPSERAIWRIIRDDASLAPVLFQKPLGKRYIVDFYFPRAALVVEIDGGYHSTPEQIERDKVRECALHRDGKRVMRFTNEQVARDAEGVVAQIRSAAHSLIATKPVRKKPEPRATTSGPIKAALLRTPVRCERCGKPVYKTTGCYRCNERARIYGD